MLLVEQLQQERQVLARLQPRVELLVGRQAVELFLQEALHLVVALQ
jgi:hypothetical protein